MTNLETAAKQALEALEHEANVGNDDAYRAERDALRRALEQPAQQESVECMCGICKLGKREPLTDEQIKAIVKDSGFLSLERFARAIEAAHGIGEKK